MYFPILTSILKATRSGYRILKKALKRVCRKLQILQGLGNNKVLTIYIKTLVELNYTIISSYISLLIYNYPINWYFIFYKDSADIP